MHDRHIHDFALRAFDWSTFVVVYDGVVVCVRLLIFPVFHLRLMDHRIEQARVARLVVALSVE